MSWNLKLNDKQASVVSRALDIYSRLLMGQIDNVLHEFPNLSYDERRHLHKIVRQYVFSELDESAYYGICSEQTDEKAKVAWDVQQVIRQALSWDSLGKDPKKDRRDWNEMMGVSFDDPFVTSLEPLAEIEKVEE